MAGSSRHSLPEHWTDLNAARAQKAKCAKDINTIKAVCRVKCDKKNLSDCPKCYPKALDVMQARYCDASGREWFTRRRAFINELGVLFTDAKEGKVDLKTIEARIESEKEAWYRWVLRMYPEFLTIADSGVDQDELRSMLDDPDKSRDQLIEKVWQGVGKPAEWERDLDDFSHKVAAAKEKEEIKKLYIAQFFKDAATDKTLDNAQKYLDQFTSSDNLSLEDIIDKIMQDERAIKSTQPQRDGKRKRLDELRRAKSTFEQDRMQAKARRQEAQMPGAAEELYDLPPCRNCRGEIDPSSVLLCSTCQALVHLGAAQQLTAYCSDECAHEDHANHIDFHGCMAGDAACAGNEDENMDGGMDESVICRACVDAKTAEGVWCDPMCAAANLARHREEKHGVREEIRDVAALVVPFGEVVERTLRERNPRVKFEPM